MHLLQGAAADGTNVWDVLAAIGTLGAVVVALWLGLLEQRRTSRRHQGDISRLEKERDEANRAAERQAQQRQARQIAVWVDDTNAPPPGGTPWQMHIANYSDAPILDVAISLVTGSGVLHAGGAYRAVLLPREHHEGNVAPLLLDGDADSLPNRLIVWEFRDIAGRYWKIDLMGRLLYENGSATEEAIPRSTGNLLDPDEQLTVDNLGY